jgi:hypothetical protein
MSVPAGDLPQFQAFSKTNGWSLFCETRRVILDGQRIFVPLLLILIGTWFIKILFDNRFGGNGGAVGAGVSLLVNGVIILCYFLTIVAMAFAAEALMTRRYISISAVYSAATRRLWPCLLTSVLVCLFALQGSVLLFVPGLILQLALFPAVAATLVEGLNPREALARSFFLTAGNKFAIFARTLRFWITCVLLFWIPLIVLMRVAVFAITGHSDKHWIKLLPLIDVDVTGAGVEGPDPVWLPYVAEISSALWDLLWVVFMIVVFESLRAERSAGMLPVPRWPAAIFIAAGLVLILYSINSFIGTKSFLAHALPATGTLVAETATTEASAGDTGDPGESVAIEFRTPDEIKHQFQTALIQEGVTDQPPGSRVPILYDPDDPTNARIMTVFFVWGVFAIAAIAGAVLFLVGLAQWIYLRRTIATMPPANGQQMSTSATGS